MQRDMDLVRDILLTIEASPNPSGLDEVPIEGRSDAEVSYHLQILMEAGMIHGNDVTSLGSGHREWIEVQLTWAGHEFLDAARDNTVWKQAITKVGGAVGTTSVAVLQTILVQIATKTLGLQ